MTRELMIRCLRMMADELDQLADAGPNGEPADDAEGTYHVSLSLHMRQVGADDPRVERLATALRTTERCELSQSIALSTPFRRDFKACIYVADAPATRVATGH